MQLCRRQCSGQTRSRKYELCAFNLFVSPNDITRPEAAKGSITWRILARAEISGQLDCHEISARSL